MAAKALPLLTPNDFSSASEVRWCPTCGDFSILSQLKKAGSGTWRARERFAFVSAQPPVGYRTI